MKKMMLFASTILLTLSLVACGGESVVDFDATQGINVYTRDTESGTREAFFKGINFEDAAEDDALLVSGKTVVSGNGDMINKIKGDEYGLGYISLSSLVGSGLIGLNFEGVEPTEENVLNNTYGLKRPFNYITRATYDNEDVEAIVEALVAYMETTEGKAVIMENGGIVNLESTDLSWNEIKDNYSICSNSVDNSAIKVYVGGSTSVEKIAKAMTADFKGKCGNFDPQHNHQGSSAAYKGTQKEGTSTDTATYLDLGFASRGIKTEEAGVEGTYGQICWDAVVAVVNSENTTISNITADQLKQTYIKDGSISMWNELS